MAIATFDVVCWHDFSEGSGSTVSDASENGHDISLVNSPTWGTSGVPSGLNGFIDLNGSTQYGTIPHDRSEERRVGKECC